MGFVARVTLVMMLSALQVAPAWAMSPGRVEFDVFRNGEPFGRHVVSVTEANDRFTVECQVALRVNVGPLTVYRYEHACRETWSLGALERLRCATLRDGRRTRVDAQLDGSRLRVTGADGELLFPLDALPTSWWIKPATSVTSMIDTETGARMALQVTDMGTGPIQAGGAVIQAHRIRVQGELAVDLWYDVQGRWVGCAFTARGQRIVYRLATPLGVAPSLGLLQS
jgi:hypothetical protein